MKNNHRLQLRKRIFYKYNDSVKDAVIQLLNIRPFHREELKRLTGVSRSQLHNWLKTWEGMGIVERYPKKFDKKRGRPYTMWRVTDTEQ
jgi:predicted transcriptional regulator